MSSNTIMYTSLAVAAAGASTYFLFFRKLKPRSSNALQPLPFKHSLMSHRGGSREWVENTLPAFRYSGNILKTDLLEMDVQLTKDKRVVIFHDDLMGRMCGSDYAKCRIGDFMYSDLPALRIPDDLADLPHVVQDRDSTRIPLLEELLEEFPLYPMQIDVKSGPEELVILTGNLIKRYKRENVTVWGSFRPAVNQMCRKHFGLEIPLFFSLPRALYLKGLWHIGLMNSVSIDESCLIMPKHWLFSNKKWIAALKERRVSVIVFGVGTGALNDPQLWQEVKELGASGICSDKPTELQKWLLKNPL